MEKVFEVRTVLGEYLGTIDVCTCEHDAKELALLLYKCKDIYVKDVTDEYEED